eukprot:2302147-Pyramimonas_sp.AAC.1
MNGFSDLSLPIVPAEPGGFLRFRVRSARDFLAALRVDSKGGPDLARQGVKNCSRELALPVCLLARSIVAHSRWPFFWCCASKEYDSRCGHSSRNISHCATF